MYGWIASLALQQLFPIQILLIFLRFELPPNFIFQCYRPPTRQFYLCFPALSISVIHKVPSITLRMGKSRDPLLQKHLTLIVCRRWRLPSAVLLKLPILCTKSCSTRKTVLHFEEITPDKCSTFKSCLPGWLAFRVG